MADGINSSQLAQFNIEGSIILDGKFGLIKIQQSDDGLLILTEDSDYGVINSKSPTKASILKRESLLGFILDIGIKKEKMLTFGSGHYFGMKILDIKSTRTISQKDFDSNVFEKIGNFIQAGYQSGDKIQEGRAIKLQLLLDAYNNARLLFPNFISDSYLGLMRILDSLSEQPRADAVGFSKFVTSVSPTLNQEIYAKVSAVQGWQGRIEQSNKLFQKLLSEEKKKNTSSYPGEMGCFSDPDKFVFCCVYSAYQYRNKFVHEGFPFPDTVKDALGFEAGLGTAYLSISTGIALSRFDRPTGVEQGDLIDIHDILGDKASNFADVYFLLLPTWFFIKSLTREALLSKINSFT